MRDELAEVNPDMLLADGFDEALIGYVERCGLPPLALYDTNKCIQILMEDGMDYEEAWEFFSFNVSGAYMGDNTPCFATILLPGYDE